MNECICVDCPNKCYEYENNYTSDKAYYEWTHKEDKCKIESEEINMSRGIITEEIKEKYHMTTKEFRLIPYVQYLLVNQMPIDPQKIDAEEREILQNWRNKGYLTFSMKEPLTASREFWDIMNSFLWDCYVLQKETESEG